MRYEIRPLNEHCEVNGDAIASTDDAGQAKDLAIAHSSRMYGVGILDTTTGALDVGFGFGMDAPEVV